MIFSAKDESGVSLFEKVMLGQKDVTTRYGVAAEKLLKKWEWYVLRHKHLSETHNWEGLAELEKKVPLICVQSKRGKKAVEYRKVVSVMRRKQWYSNMLDVIARWSRPNQAAEDIAKAQKLEAWREGFSSWVYFVGVIEAFAKSKGKAVDSGVRVEFGKVAVVKN